MTETFQQSFVIFNFVGGSGFEALKLFIARTQLLLICLFTLLMDDFTRRCKLFKQFLLLFYYYILVKSHNFPLEIGTLCCFFFGGNLLIFHFFFFFHFFKGMNRFFVIFNIIFVALALSTRFSEEH